MKGVDGEMEWKNELANTQAMKEIVEKVGKSIGQAIEEHPEKALGIVGVLGGLYLLKEKKISFKMKKGDTEIEFSSE